jgi:deazaflavin-dependent oxidoreductase (nitroreductase family)
MSGADLRLLDLIRRTTFWKRVGRLHGWLYRATGGRVGHSAGRITNLLLTTTGRKSGQERTVPLAYIQDGDSLVVVASNGGSDQPPAWWLNLQKEPRATVQTGADTRTVVAGEATGEERARLWARLTEVNPFFSRYEVLAKRTIPVVVLRPVA